MYGTVFFGGLFYCQLCLFFIIMISWWLTTKLTDTEADVLAFT